MEYIRLCWKDSTFLVPVFVFLTIQYVINIFVVLNAKKERPQQNNSSFSLRKTGESIDVYSCKDDSKKYTMWKY